MGVDDGGCLGIVIEEDIEDDGFLVGAWDGEVFDFLHWRGFGCGMEVKGLWGELELSKFYTFLIPRIIYPSIRNDLKSTFPLPLTSVNKSRASAER